MQVLEGCGRSPGFLLVGLSVRDAQSGARIRLGQATARTLLERGPQLLWAEVFRWQSGRAEAARRARIAAGRRTIEAEYADADLAERERALMTLFRENAPSASWRLPLLSAGPAALLWLLRRRVKAILPETVAVQERSGRKRPRRKRPALKRPDAISPGKVRPARIGVRGIRIIGVRRSVRALRRARRGRAVIKEDVRAARRATAS
jgi:hypothetical protein